MCNAYSLCYASDTMPRPGFIRTREARQLERLATLVDAVFAAVLVVLVIELPFPEDIDAVDGSIWSFFSAPTQALVTALIGACPMVL